MFSRAWAADLKGVKEMSLQEEPNAVKSLLLASESESTEVRLKRP